MSALSQKRTADIRAAIELVRFVLEADIAEVVQKLPGHRAMRIDPLKECRRASYLPPYEMLNDPDASHHLGIVEGVTEFLTISSTAT